MLLGAMAKGCEAAPEAAGEDSSAVGYTDLEFFARLAKNTGTYISTS